MLNYLDSMEFNSNERIRSEKLAKLKQLCEYAAVNSPAYKKIYNDAGLDLSQIKSWSDIVKIPSISRDEYIAIQRENPPFGGFLAVPPEKLKRIYIHPGPQYETLSEEDIVANAKMLWRLGIRPGDIVINSVGYHMAAGGLLIDEAVSTIGATVVPMGPGNTDLQVEVMHALKANVFLGFPMFLWTVLKRAEELGYDIKKDFNLEKGMALGTSPIRASLEQDYDIDLRELYGFLPLGFAAVECEHKCGMHVSDDFILEIVNPDTGEHVPAGEKGEVVVTNLVGSALPRIRINSGDLGYCTEEPCACGRTSTRLIRIVGRTGEAVKVKGMFIHPAEVGDVLSMSPDLSNAQIIVEHVKIKDRIKDRIKAKLEFKEGVGDKDKVIETFKKNFQNRCRLKIEEIEIVPPGTIPEDAKKIIDEREQIIL